MPSFKRRLYAITPSHRQEENRTRTFSRVEAPDETDPRPNALLLGSSTAWTGSSTALTPPLHLTARLGLKSDPVANTHAEEVELEVEHDPSKTGAPLRPAMATTGTTSTNARLPILPNLQTLEKSNELSYSGAIPACDTVSCEFFSPGSLLREGWAKLGNCFGNSMWIIHSPLCSDFPACHLDILADVECHLDILVDVECHSAFVFSDFSVRFSALTLH